MSSKLRDENEQKDIYVNPDLSKKERMKAFEIRSDLRWKKKLVKAISRTKIENTGRYQRPYKCI